MTDPRVLLVVAAFLGGFGLHAVAIWLLPLYLAQATIALALPVAAVASSLVSERLHPRDWLAVALVAMGIVLLAMGSGKPGEVRPSLLALALLGAAVIGTAVVVMVSRHVNGWLLGILAGAVYAGSAVSVRGIRWPVDATTAVAALVVPICGLVGFWLYSVALDRTSVSVATAPMVVGEVAWPTLIGVAFLGDAIRAGWTPGVVVGVLMAVTGAVLISGRSHSSPSSPEDHESREDAGDAPVALGRLDRVNPD